MADLNYWFPGDKLSRILERIAFQLTPREAANNSAEIEVAVTRQDDDRLQLRVNLGRAAARRIGGVNTMTVVFSAEDSENILEPSLIAAWHRKNDMVKGRQFPMSSGVEASSQLSLLEVVGYALALPSARANPDTYTRMRENGFIPRVLNVARPLRVDMTLT